MKGSGQVKQSSLSQSEPLLPPHTQPLSLHPNKVELPVIPLHTSLLRGQRLDCGAWRGGGVAVKNWPTAAMLLLQALWRRPGALYGMCV